MKTTPVTTRDLCGVFAVPPLARSNGARRTIDFSQNDRLVRHIASGGITRFLYGGNAFLYHITLGEYRQLLDWLAAFPNDLWPIPSIGPSYGRAIDQADLLSKYSFPAVMVLPSGDPREASGLERGLREVAAAARTPLILYLKDEGNFGSDIEAGLDAVARLVDDRVCIAIKYAVVRANPGQDPYLERLLSRVDRNLVISGMGERPAIVHLRDCTLPGFTTGSGCLAPRMCNEIYRSCSQENYSVADELRSHFMQLEDLRDAWNPARVLHHAVELAGVADTGPIPPFLTELNATQIEQLLPVARELVKNDALLGLSSSPGA